MDKGLILKDLTRYGKPFSASGLEKKDLDGSPIEQFVKWIESAIEAGNEEPNLMVLSTVSEQNAPSSRIVLIKYITDKGLVFFSNYESRKGKEIELNQKASAVIYWPSLERQVRIEGIIEKVESSFSDYYFKMRSFESQLGAIVSKQSTSIPSREYLMEKLEELDQSFKGKKLVRPYYWGGYILLPEIIEFWQGGPHRLSDRFQYRPQNGSWVIERLAP